MALATSSLIFFLLLLPLLTIAQTTNGRVSVGESLTASKTSSSWLSPSEDFAFGFHQPDKNKDLFLLSIWFEKIPAKTLVWWCVDKNESPVLVPPGSAIKLTAEKGLVLSHPGGAELWKSDIAMQEVAYGVMYDSGNFAIESRNSDKLWQSFDQPTDTLLPTQIMVINGQLFSRKNESNFSQGKFRLGLLENGNLDLNSVNLPTKLVYEEAYYSSGTNDSANSSNSGFRLIFNESGDVYVLRRNRQRSSIGIGAALPTPSSDYYQRLTLDFDGVFAQYSYPKKTTGSGTNWSTVWSLPENICSRFGQIGSGACGFSSICRLNDKGRPSCECPPGFSLLDPNDSYGNCKRNGELDCDEQISPEDAYDFKVLPGVNFAGNDYELYAPNYDMQHCRTACLHDCTCVIAVYYEGRCWKKRLPISNGRYDSSDKGMALVKVRKGDLPPTLPKFPKAGGDKKQQIFNITGSILLVKLLTTSPSPVFRLDYSGIVPIYGGIPPLISLSQYGNHV
ncbi:S-locus glycoprotein [Corchorus olitorius]|uniref:S-locus glycoprotein n=1 Tax=Corchorus olitorius TaxID=93759 RepID=A0A1R3K8R8_9ROSI|nr:S-locus glycoprotein [Corchorus olitorius]